ncbi:hypothetical protein OSTOST_25662, partial [Ostertagia ostertagi]
MAKSTCSLSSRRSAECSTHTYSHTGPSGKDVFGCVAFPPGVGKTMAFDDSSSPKMADSLKESALSQVRVLGDDIVWIKCGSDKVMYGLAPENGIFGCPKQCDSRECSQCPQ